MHCGKTRRHRIAGFIRVIALTSGGIICRGCEIVSRAFDEAGNGYVRCTAHINHIGVGVARHTIVNLVTHDVGTKAWVPRQSNTLSSLNGYAESLDGILKRGEQQNFSKKFYEPRDL